MRSPRFISLRFFPVGKTCGLLAGRLLCACPAGGCRLVPPIAVAPRRANLRSSTDPKQTKEGGAATCTRARHASTKHDDQSQDANDGLLLRTRESERVHRKGRRAQKTKQKQRGFVRSSVLKKNKIKYVLWYIREPNNPLWEQGKQAMRHNTHASTRTYRSDWFIGPHRKKRPDSEAGALTAPSTIAAPPPHLTGCGTTVPRWRDRRDNSTRHDTHLYLLPVLTRTSMRKEGKEAHTREHTQHADTGTRRRGPVTSFVRR